jgi:hypothetical protein
MEIEPPVTWVLSPELTAMRPPADFVPLPTTTLMLPAVPSVADPVRRVIIPLLPLVVVVPEVIDSDPETPDEPALADRTLKAPLDVARPYPVIRETDPPVTAVACPADTDTRPPEVTLPLPTTMLTLPAVPFVAEPVRSVIIPVLPFDAVPVVKDRDPETPPAPLSADRTLKTPLEFARP